MIRLRTRSTLVGVLALAGGALGNLSAPAALAVGPATDMCSVVSNAEIEQATGLPHVVLAKHIAPRLHLGNELSSCWILAYRGPTPKPLTGPVERAIGAGLYVELKITSIAFLTQPCAPTNTCESTTLEDEWKDDLAAAREYPTAKNEKLALPSFGAEAGEGVLERKCGKQGCGASGIWWTTPIHSEVSIEIAGAKRPVIAKELERIAGVAVPGYFG